MTKEQIQHCFYLRSKGLSYAAIAFTIGVRHPGSVYRVVNRDKAKAYQKSYRSKNSDQIRTSQREYQKQYRVEHSLKAAEYQRNYVAVNRDKVALRKKHYRLRNIESINSGRKHRFHNDTNYRLSILLRTRLRKALFRGTKRGSAVQDLGCTVEELKQHLEDQFTEGMNWENQGEWHIDHIIPMSSFDLTDRDQLLECCHFTNLQPLWALENLRKGNKII